jgi:hypothetical protein
MKEKRKLAYRETWGGTWNSAVVISITRSLGGEEFGR